MVRVLGQCLVSNGPEGAAEVKSGGSETANASPKAARKSLPAEELPRPMQAGLKEAGNAETANSKPDGAKKMLAANDQPQAKGADQKDDLLFPTEEELRAIKAQQGRREISPA